MTYGATVQSGYSRHDKPALLSILLQEAHIDSGMLQKSLFYFFAKTLAIVCLTRRHISGYCKNILFQQEQSGNRSESLCLLGNV